MGVRELGRPEGNPLGRARASGSQIVERAYAVKALRAVGSPTLLAEDQTVVYQSACTFDGNKLLVGYYQFNGTTTSYRAALFRISGDNLTLVGTSTLDSSLTPRLDHVVSFNGVAYVFFNNTLYSFTDTGSSLAIATVKSNCIPSSGTLTIGGSSYLSVAFGGYDLVHNGLNEQPCPFRDSGDGNIAIFCTITSSLRTACFVIDTSGNVVRSFSVTVKNASTQDSQTYYLLHKIGVGKFALLMFCPHSSTNSEIRAINVDVIAGTSSVGATNISQSIGSISAGNQIGCVISPGRSMSIFWDSSDASLVAYFFTVDLNESGITGSIYVSSVFTGTASELANTGKFCHEYGDFLSNKSVGITAAESRLIQARSPSSNVCIWSFNSVSGVDGSGASRYHLYVQPKAVSFYTNEPSGSTWGLPYSGPNVLARLSESRVICSLGDENSSLNKQRRYFQIYEAI